MRWARLNVVQPPSPTGTFTFSSLFTDQPGAADTGTPLASFLLGQVQAFSIDLQHDRIQERAHVQEYFVQDDWRVSDRVTLNPGVRYTLNFPSTEINGQTAVFNLHTQQLEYPGTAPVRELHKDNFGPRFGVVYRRPTAPLRARGMGWCGSKWQGSRRRSRRRRFRSCRPSPQRTLDNITPAFVLQNGPPWRRSSRRRRRAWARACSRSIATSAPATCSSGTRRCSASSRSTSRSRSAYVGSTITHVGIPDTNLNQLTVDQLALGTALTQRVANPYFGIIPRSSSLGDPTITGGAAAQAVSRSTRR